MRYGKVICSFVGFGMVMGAANAATIDISIQNMAFNPDMLTIGIGDTVRWTNNDFFMHTVTSDTNLFDSGTLFGGNQFSFTFDATGSYDYHCQFHSTMMMGTVEVVPEPGTWLVLGASSLILLRRKRI